MTTWIKFQIWQNDKNLCLIILSLIIKMVIHRKNTPEKIQACKIFLAGQPSSGRGEVF